jgi:hypothetical protein
MVETPRTDAGQGLREPLLAAGLAITAFLLAAGPPALSPDSHELLATTRCWAGLAPCEGPTPWPPLWPLAVLPFARLDLRLGAWLLNLTLAGAVAAPLVCATRRLGGVWTARAAALCWVLLPATLHNAPVLDARPLLWWLSAASIALSLRAHALGRGWWGAFAVASLAPLARPEGLFLLPLVACGALLGGAGARALVLAAASAVPLALHALLGGASRLGYEAFSLPWDSVWSRDDTMALVGPASAATPFRQWLLRAAAAGLERPDVGLADLLRLLPGGFANLAHAIAGGLGLVAGFGVLLGALVLGRRGWRAVAALLLGGAPLVALAALPMSWVRSSPSANLVFLLPGLLVVAGVGWTRALPRRWEAWLPALAILAAIELRLAPWRLHAPVFLGGEVAAGRMTRFLEGHLPAGGRLVCTYPSRHVVRAAGLVPVQLPSGWDHLDPQAPVLLTKEFLLDGGRSLALLESGRYRLRYWSGPAWGPAMGELDWYLYLEPAAAP